MLQKHFPAFSSRPTLCSFCWSFTDWPKTPRFAASAAPPTIRVNTIAKTNAAEIFSSRFFFLSNCSKQHRLTAFERKLAVRKACFQRVPQLFHPPKSHLSSLFFEHLLGSRLICDRSFRLPDAESLRSPVLSNPDRSAAGSPRGISGAVFVPPHTAAVPHLTLPAPKASSFQLGSFGLQREPLFFLLSSLQRLTAMRVSHFSLSGRSPRKLSIFLYALINVS